MECKNLNLIDSKTEKTKELRDLIFITTSVRKNGVFKIFNYIEEKT